MLSFMQHISAGRTLWPTRRMALLCGRANNLYLPGAHIINQRQRAHTLQQHPVFAQLPIPLYSFITTAIFAPNQFGKRHRTKPSNEMKMRARGRREGRREKRTVTLARQGTASEEE